MITAKTFFSIDDTALDSMLKNPIGEVGRWLARKGEEMEQAARAQVGVQTGRLKESIYHEQERTAYGQRLVVGATSEYAYYHHEGTGEHVINAHAGGGLRFAHGGRIVTVKRVYHRGNKPNKFLSDQLVLLKAP